MAMKFIAVQGFSTQISDNTITAVIAPTGVPSIKCKVDNKGICKDQFTLSLTAITQGAFVNPGPLMLTFSATSTKIKADNTFVLREDDTTNTISGYVLTNPSGTTTTVSFSVKISNAGQSKVRGE